jgi:hypothetical protein
MSGSKTTYLKTFLRQMTEVVNQLESMFPEDPDFKTFSVFLGVLQYTNPATVISTFQEHVVLKYEAQITGRDEKFILSHMPVEYGNDLLDIISKFKTYWTILSTGSKDSLWQYLHVLTQLCKKYYES